MLSGCFVALVTPFKKGALDEGGLRRNIRFLLDNKVSGLVPCATTGEAPCLDEDEYERVIQITVQEARGKVRVIPGAGTNSTTKTITLVARARRLGADGCLVVTPYYNRPSQDGLFAHFKAVAETARIPIVIYNVPGRTGVNILPATVRRLAWGSRHIVGIKEASGNLDQVSELVRTTGRDFSVLSGDDSLTLPMLALGARGVISVAGNIVPRAMSEMIALFRAGKAARARAVHARFFPLMKVLFVETNPVPVKTAMKLLGMPAGELRLPLVPMSNVNTRRLREELKRVGLLR
jgi:4-hydroxy-tetrahydrodipicolinate synthase